VQEISSDVFNPPHSLKTAVLFLVFNRPDTTKQVFEAIRQAKPPRLYVAADGPRDDKPGEQEKCEQVRRIATQVDWDCEVKTLFRDKNLGCRIGVSTAIDWFFENEEEGIILEDDCLPSQSFFWFCEELLERYRNDMRVWHIAGNNFHNSWIRDKDYSYYFSYYGSIWGWATWLRAWNYYSCNMNGYNEIKTKEYLNDLFGNKKESEFRIANFDAIKNGLDTWDFQWAYTKFINSALSIVPNVNLIKNIGFNHDAAHTVISDGRENMIINNIIFPIKHPFFVIRDKKSDDKFFKSIDNSRNILKKIKNRIYKYLK